MSMEDQLDALERANTQLVRDVREMDQLVFQMAQAGTPDQLRSAVARAWAITEARMRAESNRITEMLTPEIKKVYNAPKATAGQLPKLEGPKPPLYPSVHHARRIGKD